MLRRSVWALALLASLPARVAWGQQDAEPAPTRDPRVEEARALFLAGSEAVRAGRWADALPSFQRSYELSGAPSALLNAGLALRALGRNREARDALERLLRVHGANLSAELRPRAEEALREVSVRVAALLLAGLPSAPDPPLSILVDGRSFPDGGNRPLRVELDAGAHSLAVDRRGFETFRWEDTLRDGEARSVEVQMVPRALSAGQTSPDRTRPGRPRRAHRETSGGFVGSPAFWIIGGAVVVAAGVTAGYFILSPAELEPQSSWTVRL